MTVVTVVTPVTLSANLMRDAELRESSNVRDSNDRLGMPSSGARVQQQARMPLGIWQVAMEGAKHSRVSSLPTAQQHP
ncbi:MAG: hypothetical protein ACREOG_08180 [Gemmatimonadaceae bacterium]